MSKSEYVVRSDFGFVVSSDPLQMSPHQGDLESGAKQAKRFSSRDEANQVVERLHAAGSIGVVVEMPDFKMDATVPLTMKKGAEPDVTKCSQCDGVIGARKDPDDHFCRCQSDEAKYTGER